MAKHLEYYKKSKTICKNIRKKYGYGVSPDNFKEDKYFTICLTHVDKNYHLNEYILFDSRQDILENINEKYILNKIALTINKGFILFKPIIRKNTNSYKFSSTLKLLNAKCLKEVLHEYNGQN